MPAAHRSDTPASRRLHIAPALATLSLGLVLAAGWSCTGRGGRLSLGAGPDTVFVGVAVGLTSPERYVNVFTGVQLALDELNARKAEGAPVLAMRRAPASAASPVEVAAAFRDDPRVVGVVGHTESGPTIAAAPVYDDRENGGRNALIAITPTASATAVTTVSDWIFRVAPVASAQAGALARYVADSLKVRRAGVLFRNDPSGKDFLRAFTAEFNRLGGTVVERDPFVEEIPDFTPFARRLAKRGVPSVVISGNAGPAVMLAMQRAGSRPRVLATNPPGAGDGPIEQYNGMLFVHFYSPTATAEGARFAAAFKRRHGAAADHWAALSYDAAMLIGAAVHAEGPNRRRIRDHVAAVGRTRPAYAGVTGNITFDAQGDPVKKLVMVDEVGR